MIKLGGSNIFNHYYKNAFANPEVGGLYYVSFGYNLWSLILSKSTEPDFIIGLLTFHWRPPLPSPSQLLPLQQFFEEELHEYKFIRTGTIEKRKVG